MRLFRRVTDVRVNEFTNDTVRVEFTEHRIRPCEIPLRDCRSVGQRLRIPLSLFGANPPSIESVVVDAPPEVLAAVEKLDA